MLITGTNGKRGADACLLTSSGLLLFGLLPSLCSEEYDREINVLVSRDVDLVVILCDNGRESRIAELSIEKRVTNGLTQIALGFVIDFE